MRYFLFLLLVITSSVVIADRIPRKFLGWWDIREGNEHHCEWNSPTRVKINPTGIQIMGKYHLLSCIWKIDDNEIYFSTLKSGDRIALPRFYYMDRGRKKTYL